MTEDKLYWTAKEIDDTFGYDDKEWFVTKERYLDDKYAIQSAMKERVNKELKRITDLKKDIVIITKEHHHVVDVLEKDLDSYKKQCAHLTERDCVKTIEIDKLKKQIERLGNDKSIRN